MHTLGVCNRLHTHQVAHARARTKPYMPAPALNPVCSRSCTHQAHATGRTRTGLYMPALAPNAAYLCSHQATHACARTRLWMPVLAPGHACLRSHLAPHACVCTSPTPACALTPHPCVHSLAPYSHLPTFSCTHPAHLGIVNTWTYTLMRLIV